MTELIKWKSLSWWTAHIQVMFGYVVDPSLFKRMLQFPSNLSKPEEILPLFLVGLRLKKRLCQVQTCKTHLNCSVWRLILMDALINVSMTLVTATGVMVVNPHGIHRR